LRALWAEGSGVTSAEFWTGVSAVISAVVAGIVMLMSKRREGKAADRLDAREQREQERKAEEKERRGSITEWRGLYLESKNHRERQEQVIEAQQKAMEALHGEHAECRETVAEQSAAIHFVYGQLKNFHRLLCEGGHNPGELPDLPWRQHAPGSAAAGAEFLVAQARQSADLAKKAGEVLPRPPGEKEGGP
jgi:hypothetical protein